METERIACPMCGWWRTSPYGVRATGETREVHFDQIDPATAPMWRLERLIGAGRGSKDAKIETLETKTLIDLPDGLKEEIRQQCHKILEVLNEGPASTPRPGKPLVPRKSKQAEND